VTQNLSAKKKNRLIWLIFRKCVKNKLIIIIDANDHNTNTLRTPGQYSFISHYNETKCSISETSETGNNSTQV